MIKFGVVGQSPKCKMQNAKCKIGMRGKREYSRLKNDFLYGRTAFGCLFVKSYHKLAFAQAKGLINFAFCIFKLPGKLQFINQSGRVIRIPIAYTHS